MTTMPPAEAREAAREILARDEFRRASTPRPLRGVLRRLGEWVEELLEPLLRPFGDAWSWVADEPERFVPVAVIVLALAALASIGLGRRRGAFVGHDANGRRWVDREDAGALDRLAAAAERDGDLDLAVRLRFRAGLIRLGEQGALAYRPSLTAGAVVRAVEAPSLGALAASFEEIAYGGRRASVSDVELARVGWPRVLQEARP